MQSTMSQQQSTLFLCPVEGCDMRFKSTHGRTQHIFAKHPNFGINEPGHSGESSRSDNNLPVNGMNTRLGAHLSRSIDSSPSSHTSQFDQADEHMINDSDPPSVDFLQPPMTHNHFSSPPPFGELLPFPTSQSPAIHPHDGSPDADDIEPTVYSQPEATSFFLNNPPSDMADEPATCAFTDYHPILNGKFNHSILTALC